MRQSEENPIKGLEEKIVLRHGAGLEFEGVTLGGRLPM